MRPTAAKTSTMIFMKFTTSKSPTPPCSNGLRVIKEQDASQRASQFGQYVHNLQPRHTYTYGGISRINQSAQKDGGFKDQFGLLQEVNRQQYVGRSTSLNPRSQSANKYSRARAFYPKDYYRRVGYQPSEASVVSGKSRTDALGQRVRQRFNEEIDYKETAQAMPVNRLDRAGLSQMSARQSVPNLSTKGSQRSKAVSVV